MSSLQELVIKVGNNFEEHILRQHEALIMWDQLLDRTICKYMPRSSWEIMDMAIENLFLATSIPKEMHYGNRTALQLIKANIHEHIQSQIDEYYDFYVSRL